MSVLIVCTDCTLGVKSSRKTRNLWSIWEARELLSPWVLRTRRRTLNRTNHVVFQSRCISRSAPCGHWHSKCANCLYIYEGGSVTRNEREGLCLPENWNGERNFQIVLREMQLLHIAEETIWESNTQKKVTRYSYVTLQKKVTRYRYSYFFFKSNSFQLVTGGSDLNYFSYPRPPPPA